jgi:hypothetical protein
MGETRFKVRFKFLVYKVPRYPSNVGVPYTVLYIYGAFCGCCGYLGMGLWKVFSYFVQVNIWQCVIWRVQRRTSCPNLPWLYGILLKLLHSEMQDSVTTELLNVIKRGCKNNCLVDLLIYGQSITILIIIEIYANFSVLKWHATGNPENVMFPEECMPTYLNNLCF